MLANNTPKLTLLKYYSDNIHGTLFDTDIHEISKFIDFMSTIQTTVYEQIEENTHFIKISRLHCATIVAKLFLNKIPDIQAPINSKYKVRNFNYIFNKSEDASYSELPNSDMQYINSNDEYRDSIMKILRRDEETGSNVEIDELSLEKIKFIMNYFDIIYRLYKDNPAGILNEYVEFRKYKKKQNLINKNININNFIEKNVKIVNKKIEDVENIEDSKIIFANKYLGGSVLTTGCCQEEIYYLTHPELFVAMVLFDYEVEDNEYSCVEIINCMKYSNYSNYGFNTKFNQTDKYTIVKSFVEIDAYRFNQNNKQLQYQKKYINREINKCIAGFFNSSKEIITTGNWGCGAFGGDAELKFLIQLFVAILYDKQLIYCTNDIEILNRLKQKKPNMLYAKDLKELKQIIDKFKE